MVRYGAGIMDWTKEKLKNLDWKTRKIMSMNGALHTRSNVSRLYLPRKEGERGLISVAEYVETEGWMLKAAWEEEVITRTTESLEECKKKLYEMKVRDWKNKPLHGAFVRDIEETPIEESWRWLRNGYLKKETEGMICAAQEQALRANSIKWYIDKTNDSPLCRLCGKSSESVWQVVNGCAN